MVRGLRGTPWEVEAERTREFLKENGKATARLIATHLNDLPRSVAKKIKRMDDIEVDRDCKPHIYYLDPESEA